MDATGIRIIERGAGWIAVDKPAGMLSVPGKVETDCVVARVAALVGGFAREAHRLDMETSGVMVVALDAAAHRGLSMQFEAGTVMKRYVAVVEGSIERAMGVVRLPIRADVEDRPRQVVDHQQGKPSVTRWERMGVEEIAGRVVTRLRLDPETGRTHQLRVHCAHAEGLGAAIVGDSLYGSHGSPLPSPAATPSPLRGEGGKRMMLHAERIAFDDPGSGERVVVERAVEF